MTERLARRCARHPWRTVTRWLVAVVLGLLATGALLGDGLTSEGRVTNGADSVRALDLAEERLGEDVVPTELLIARTGAPGGAAAARTAAERVLAEARHSGAVAEAGPPRVAPDDGRPRPVDPARRGGRRRPLRPGDGRRPGAPRRARARRVRRRRRRGARRRADRPEPGLLRRDGGLAADRDRGVLALSLLLLTVAFRSVAVAGMSIALNLLSVGAAYGLLVLVFQHGAGAGLLGFQEVDTIEAWVPLFLFAVLFGLSMDYQVFLLSRIRERYTDTRDTRQAVVFGVGTTARIITGAALIIVAVFAGFASGELVMFQQMGFGVAVALLIDATIVRSVLTPACMTLLGARSWYLPSWLGWLPHIEVEGRRREGPVADAPAVGGAAVGQG